MTSALKVDSALTLINGRGKIGQEGMMILTVLLTEFLKSKLDEYVAENLPKTRIVRAEKREGLIRARLLGAKAARGAILIFLDSHSEVNTNWLPPLIGNKIIFSFLFLFRNLIQMLFSLWCFLM